MQAILILKEGSVDTLDLPDEAEHRLGFIAETLQTKCVIACDLPGERLLLAPYGHPYQGVEYVNATATRYAQAGGQLGFREVIKGSAIVVDKHAITVDSD